MANRSSTSSPASVLDQLTGHRIPGGCDDCDAYQTMTKRDNGVFRVTVHHDDTCPWLNARTSR